MWTKTHFQEITPHRKFRNTPARESAEFQSLPPTHPPPPPSGILAIIHISLSPSTHGISRIRRISYGCQSTLIPRAKWMTALPFQENGHQPHCHCSNGSNSIPIGRSRKPLTPAIDYFFAFSESAHRPVQSAAAIAAVGGASPQLTQWRFKWIARLKT